MSTIPVQTIGSNPDLLSLVAKFTRDEDLISLASTSVDCRYAALKERFTRTIDLKKRELQEFIQLTPDAGRGHRGTHLIDFYKNFLVALTSGADLGIGITAEDGQTLRQTHGTLLTSIVADEILELTTTINMANSSRQLSFEQIHESCERLKYSVISKAVNQMILRSSNPINFRGVLVMISALNQQIHMMRSVLTHGNISDEHRGLALRTAVRQSDASAEIVAELLASGRISDADRGLAIMNIPAGGGDALVEILEKLLASGRISDEHRGLAVAARAADNAPIEIFQLLLASGPISDMHRGQAVISAAMHFQAPVIACLLRTGNISPQHRAEAVSILVQNNRADIAAMLQQQ